MKTKNYRAATMRDVLEKVKQELGENALVLDSKRVRSGGLLGFGSSEQVEVRVAVENDNKDERKETERRASPRSKSEMTSFSLTDDAPALPAREDAAGRKGNSAFAALAVRAYQEDTAGRRSDEGRSEAEKPPTGIELTSSAPRIVHRKNSVQTPPASLPLDDSLVSDVPPVPHSQLSSELERMRAELREVKFSLGALSSRTVVAGSGVSNLSEVLETDSEIYDSPYFEAYMELAALGLAPELARRALREEVCAARHPHAAPLEVAYAALKVALPTLLKFGDDPLASADATTPVVALIGPTGVGKTTTIAKLAARVALRERRRVELIALDTYRIAAVEQLRTYAEIIGAGFHVPRSVLELDALLSRFEGEATVLIDTAGRSPNDLADQLELADYLRASEPIVKCLVLQATTHPMDAQVAVAKFALYGANRLIITKLDETTRPGAAVSTVAGSVLPLLYLCAGQRVPEDIERASPETFSARVLRAPTLAAA